MTRYVIVGGSAGAVGAVEGIRKSDPFGEITVVTEEPMAPYSRPAIGEHLDGRVDLESLRFGSLDLWNEYSVQVLLDRRATSIDFGEKTVKLEIRLVPVNCPWKLLLVSP
jgi:NADPH-dependent 2,4-dienoyl-CoA reductase/sulfur reductase-like enzyme